MKSARRAWTALLACGAALGLAGCAHDLGGSGRNSLGDKGAVEARGVRTVRFTYAFTVTDIPPDANQVTAWVPLPRSTANQKVLKYKIRSQLPHREVTESEYGNRFLQFDLTDAARGGGPVSVTIDYVVTRKAYRALPKSPPERAPGAASPAGGPDLPVHLARYLRPDRMVPIGGRIAIEAREAAGGAATPLATARKLYDHIVDTVKYDKSGEGWGRGDALYACDIRKGNCTDFHSLYIGESRSLGLPARFVMGVPLPRDKTEGTIPGYHCWAEFHLEGRGWVPLDASEAHKHPDRKEDLFGGLDQHRIAFTIGRDIRIPGAAGGRANYAIYAYAEVDGKPHEGVTTRFTFQDIP